MSDFTVSAASPPLRDDVEPGARIGITLFTDGTFRLELIDEHGFVFAVGMMDRVQFDKFLITARGFYEARRPRSMADLASMPTEGAG